MEFRLCYYMYLVVLAYYVCAALAVCGFRVKPQTLRGSKGSSEQIVCDLTFGILVVKVVAEASDAALQQ